MRLISSKGTFFSKRVFPVVWFGFLACFVLTSVITAPGKKPVALPFLALPAVMAIFGFIIMKLLVFDLADSVWDDGDALVVKNKGWEERIALANIINVSSSMSNPPRITLTLREECRWGKVVVFSPPTEFFRFTRPSQVATDLIERIDRQRQRR